MRYHVGSPVRLRRSLEREHGARVEVGTELRQRRDDARRRGSARCERRPCPRRAARSRRRSRSRAARAAPCLPCPLRLQAARAPPRRDGERQRQLPGEPRRRWTDPLARGMRMRPGRGCPPPDPRTALWRAATGLGTGAPGSRPGAPADSRAESQLSPRDRRHECVAHAHPRAARLRDSVPHRWLPLGKARSPHRSKRERFVGTLSIRSPYPPSACPLPLGRGVLSPTWV